MCIITDANVLGDLNAQTEDAVPVLEWLLLKNGGLIIGGHLREELQRSKRFQETLVVLNRAGRLHHLNDDKVSAIAAEIEPKCCSNDSHVVAAVIVSGCRLVFTKDHDLHKDLKNKKLCDPAAAIYQSKSHKHLLTECDCKI